MATKPKVAKEPVVKAAKVTAPAATAAVKSKSAAKPAVAPSKAAPVKEAKPASKAKQQPPVVAQEAPKAVVSKQAAKPVKKVISKVEPVAVVDPVAPQLPVPGSQDPRWQEIRLILEKLKDDTVREIRKSVKNGTEAVAAIEPGGDIYDQASSERDRELGLLLGDREREKIHSIDEALLRIDEGDYGICEECDEDIPLGRLKAMPFTRHCVKCKSDLEKLQAQTKRVEEERAYREIPLGAEDEES